MKVLKLARKAVETANRKAFDFVEGFFLSDSPKLVFTIKTIDMSYEILNKKRIILEVKRTRAQLKANHKIKQGTLLRTKRELNARPGISIEEYKWDWVKIPEGAMLMFVDVEHDHNFDAVTLKVLWDQRVYFIHKNANFKDYSSNFRDNFEVLL